MKTYLRGMINQILNYRQYKKINQKVTGINLESMPVFKQIEIETVNRCNGKCAFCPVNALQEQRPYAKMTEELFQKIIADLKKIDYKGKVCFSSNNEPFLDSRIVEWIAYARKELNETIFYMWTNGSLLTVEIMERILPYLNQLYIDCYSDNHEITQNMDEIVSYLDKNCKEEYGIYEGLNMSADKKICIFIRDINQVMSSRGGQAPNKNDKIYVPHVKCLRPFENMVIRPDGKVSLCCCDALGKYTMGDVGEESVIEVWSKSKEYYKVRKKQQTEGRKSLYLCDKCDFV